MSGHNGFAAAHIPEHPMAVKLLYKTPYMDRPEVHKLPSDENGNVETSELIDWLKREWGTRFLYAGDSFTLAADD